VSPETATLLALALDARVEPPDDALSNRVLDAALALSAASGISNLTMDDVARRAGVGVGTVYRHFANREALLEALAVDCITDVQGHARAALEESDPWTGLERFVWAATEKLAGDVLSAESLAGPAPTEGMKRCSAKLSELIYELAGRARAAGSLRADLSAEQVESILRHLGGAVRGAERSGFEWRSYVRVVLDGLRA
jgi:AcrR family transcriptional regulator